MNFIPAENATLRFRTIFFLCLIILNFKKSNLQLSKATFSLIPWSLGQLSKIRPNALKFLLILSDTLQSLAELCR